MSIPSVYLIGAPKAGTTSLAYWLAGHPEVFFSVPKEPYHWASDYPGLRAHYGFDSRAAYEQLFAAPDAGRARLRAEGSTNYLYSRSAVPAILADVGQPRFIVALRQPADLLRSYHRTQLVTLNEDETDFAAAWRRSLDGRGPQTTPLDPKLVDYPMVGGLGAAVERLLGLVPRDSVHFVLFDDLAADPATTWTDLTAFLDIAQAPSPSFEIHNASTKTYRSASLRRLTHRPPALLAGPMRQLRQWSRTTSNPLAAKLKATMWRPQGRPQANPAVRACVTQFFAADIQRLGELIDRDLSPWVRVPSRW